MLKIQTKNTLIILAFASIAIAFFLSMILVKYFDTFIMRYSLKQPSLTSARYHATDNKTADNITSSSSPEDIIAKRNLFRAKLQIEIPKPKSEKEIEDEIMHAAVKDLSLKGVWIGKSVDDIYAVIDKGGTKGVWTYGLGEIVEKGLAVAEIKPHSVLLKKNDYAFTLKLFAKGYEKEKQYPSNPVVLAAQTTIKPMSTSTTQATQQNDWVKLIKKEGRNVLIPKDLAEKIKADNSIVTTSIAVKGNLDKDGKFNGYKIVAVDKGSIMDKIGIKANDIIQEVNGYKLTSQEDAQKAYNELKNSTSFEVKVMRNNRPTTLYYQIR